MIRLFKWVGLGLGGILVLAVLAAFILPALVNLERYRGILAGRAGKALGREVTLGALRVSLWGGIGAEAKGIQIAQAAGFGSQPFLTAETLRVRVQLLPLLRGQVKVSTAVLERPHIRVLHARDGRWSVNDLLTAPAASPHARPAGEVVRPGKVPAVGGLLLSEIAVRDGEITLQDQTRSPGVTLTLSDLDLRVRQASVFAPLEVRSRARLGGGRIEATGRISAGDADDPLLDVTLGLREVDAASWQGLLFDGGGMTLSGTLSADIKVTGPVTHAALSGNLNLKPMGIQAGEGFRKAAGEEAGLRFEGRREEYGVNLPKVFLTLKEVKLDGSLRIPDLRTPRITFTATSPKVDLDRLLRAPSPSTAWPGIASAHAAAPVRPGGEARAGRSSVEAQGRIAIGDLRYSGLALSGVQADIRYQDGVVQFPDLRAGFMNGKVAAKGEVDLRPRTPRTTLTARLDNVATEPLVRALGRGPWTLRSTLSLNGRLSFTGFSAPQILGSAAGGGSLLLTDGRLSGYRPLDRLSEVISPILVGQGIRVRLDEFEQVNGHYTLDNGILRTKDLTLTKTEGTVMAAGSLGLLDSSLDFDVVAKLGRTIVEAKLTGTTSQPIVLPKLGRLQRKIETELDKALPGEQGKSLKELFKGLFGR